MTFERKRSCMSFLVEGRSKSIFTVGSVVEWLRRRAYDQHGLGSKPTRVVLLYPWERHFTGLGKQLYKWTAISWYLCKQVGVIAYPMY